MIQCSKFEESIAIIEREFDGPCPLDPLVLGNLVSRNSGIYIWFETLNGRRVGYVGQTLRLLDRLLFWTSRLDSAEVYFKYVNPRNVGSDGRKMDLKSRRSKQEVIGMNDNKYNPSNSTFYGSRGKQGKHTFFITTLKLREVYDTFRFYLEAPEERGDYEVHQTKSGRKKVIRHRDANIEKDFQRIRDPNKVDEIIEYLKKNRENWVFSSLTASCDSEIYYDPLAEDDRLGKIRIRKGSRLLINDGQHRADAIGKIWNGGLLDRHMEDFGDQSISVVIYEGQHFGRMQQMFIDLQKGTAVNKSLDSELSYSTDNQLVREVRDSVPFFSKLYCP